uniref:Uncharacterized protein n=1 Tax=Anguilla anguilla TaxID=7936 RepID=A0A0E9Y199_ANGAN
MRSRYMKLTITLLCIVENSCIPVFGIRMNFWKCKL